MALANVALTDTFDTWRIRTNQLCSLYDQAANGVNSAVTVSGISYTQGNVAFSQANAAYAFANIVSGNAKAAFNQANAAYVRANSKLTAVDGTAGRIVTTANGSYSYIVDLATAGSGAQTYTDGISAIAIDAYGRVSAVVGSAGYQPGLGFTPVQQGGGPGQGANKLYIGWATSKLALQVDSTDYGTTWPIDTSGVAAKASTLAQGGGTGLAMTFRYIGSAGQPTYVWGTNNGTDVAVWNPSNFSVNYAASAGNLNNGTIYTQGNQINCYPTIDADNYTLSVNYVGYNSAGTRQRNLAVFDGKSQYIAYFQASDRSFYSWGNVVAYNSSDIKLKENITPITNALDKVSQINGVEFDWTDEYLNTCINDAYFTRKHDVGVIAQEIEKVLPEVVSTRSDGIKAVKYDRIVALLIEAIKELKAEVEELKSAK